MDRTKEIQKRRSEILGEMEAIRSMRRGCVNEQFLKVPHKGKKDPIVRGPYYVFSRYEKGKGTKSYRLTTTEEVEQARCDVEAHKRFRELCSEFEDLTEELGRVERSLGESSPGKKNSKRKSRPTKK